MAKRSIRKLRHLPIECSVERSPSFKSYTESRAKDAADRASFKAAGAEFRKRRGGRDERVRAARAAKGTA